MIMYSPNRKYNALWQKYRPVILRLMVDSGAAPQQYQLSGHEITRLNPTERKGHSFALTLHKSKSVNNIRTSDIAKDLLTMLQQSKTAIDLSELATYEFIMDSKHVLRVSKQADKVEMQAEEEIENVA
jgi:hypothetical protein